MRSLRKLRNERGLSIDDIAERTRMQADVLAAAEAGQELPSLPVLQAYLRGCGEDLAPWEERWRRLLPAQETRDDLLPVREPGASDAAPARAAAEAAATEAAAAETTAAEAAGGGEDPGTGRRPGQPAHRIVRLGPPPPRRARNVAAVVGAVVLIAALGTGGTILLTGNSGHPGALAPRPTRDPARSPSPSTAPSQAPTPPAHHARKQPHRHQPPTQHQQQDEPRLAVAGVGCPAAGYDGVQVINASRGPGWFPDGGGWTGNGCDGNTVWTMNPNGTQDRPSALIWFFHPAAGASRCALAVFIPVRNALGTGSYQVFADGVAGPVTVNQAASAGTWVQLGSYHPAGAPVKIVLAPAGSPAAGPDGRVHGHHPGGPGHNSAIAASAASATCT